MSATGDITPPFSDVKDEEDLFSSAIEEQQSNPFDEYRTEEDLAPSEKVNSEINLNEESDTTVIKSNTSPLIATKDYKSNSDSYSYSNNIEIIVAEPEKRGDGISSFIVYKVSTRTTIPQFNNPESVVYRRFSDFLGLNEKLGSKYQIKGFIIPPPPEKDVVGTTKLKISKDDASGDFLERRRASLQRYLNRIAKHAELVIDDIFIEFLEKSGDLPKSNSTSTFSGAGISRLFNKVNDSINKITFKMDETDQWFEEKQMQIETLDSQLHRLHSAIDGLVLHRKELASCSKSVSHSIALLSSIEEHGGLSRAMDKLKDVEDKMHSIHLDQADADFYSLSELIGDYIGLIAAAKDSLNQRVKLCKVLNDAEASLMKKREIQIKADLARKSERAAQDAVTESERRVDRAQNDFDEISVNIRKELGRFEKQRINDFKTTIINYLERLMNSQQKVVEYWEHYLPEAKSIV